MIRKRPSLQSLHLPFIISRRSESELDNTGIASRSSRSGSTSSSSITGDTDNSDLLDDDPFAVDPSRFFCMSTPVSGNSTPSMTFSFSSRTSSRSSEGDGDGETEMDQRDPEDIKVEPLHRMPLSPSSSLHRTRSRRSTRALKPILPCLQELETRLVVSVEPGPRSAVAKAKAKHLPFEPWYNVPDMPQTAPIVEKSQFPPSSDLPYLKSVSNITSSDDIGKSTGTPVESSPSPPLTTTSSSSTPIIPDMKYHNYQNSLASESQRTVGRSRTSDSQDNDDGYYKRGAIGDFDTDHGRGCGYRSSAGVRDARDTADIEKNSSQTRQVLVSSFSDSNSDGGPDKSTTNSDEDSYGHDSPSAVPQTPEPQEMVAGASSKLDSLDSEDDIPLAQRIPTALAAQRTIRRQQRDQKRERPISAREAKATRRSEELSSHVSPLPIEDRVAIPSSRQSSEAVLADDLSRRLLEVQITSKGELPVPSSPLLASPAIAQFQGPAIRPPRSPLRLPLSTDSPTSSHARRASVNKLTKTPPVASTGLARSATSVVPRRPAELTETSEPALPAYNYSLPGRIRASEPIEIVRSEGYSNKEEYERTIRRSTTAAGNSQPRRSQSQSRPSSGSRYSHEHHEDASATPLVPPLPLSAISKTLGAFDHTPSPMMASAKVQQRIFIVNSKRHVTLDLEDTTRAKDVVEMVRAKGELRDDENPSAPGDWMLWELANDSGMERPIRSFERPSDIISSWNIDKRVNAFVVKKTTLARILAKESIPGVAPLHGGYVEWESRRGKWNKRWMELRECSLFLAKKENSKDDVFLCSLSNFDAYLVSPRHRSPKAFTFAVKSADNATLFENPADYMHVFSCDIKAGQTWLEKILVTRSYVLQQERTILFRGQSGVAGVSTNLNSSRKVIPAAPLVSVGPPATSTTGSAPIKQGPFEPGSLLAKHAS